MATDRITAFRPQVLAALRIMTALLYMQHGLQILYHFPDATKPVEGYHLTVHSIGGMMQVFGGAALVLGLLTRPVAFLLSGEMAYAYFVYHAKKSFYPVLNGGDESILLSFIFLYLFVAGPGAWALDSLIGKRGPKSITADAVA